MNLLFIGGVIWFFAPFATVRRWVVLMLWLSAAVGSGLWWFEPGIQVYAGASGVAQGLLTWGLLQQLTRTPVLALLFLLLQWGRIIFEHTPYYHADYLQTWIYVPVAVSAHLLGAVGGLIFVLFQGLMRWLVPVIHGSAMISVKNAE